MNHLTQRRLRLFTNLFVALCTLLVGLTGLAPANLTAIRPAQAAPNALTYHVKPGPVTGNCYSWLGACSLTKALGLATAGSEIWVAEGVYLPTTNTDDRSATFQLKNGVTLYGGFDPDGGADTFEERNWQTHRTILSGDIDDNDQTVNDIVLDATLGITGTNSYHVVTGSNVTTTAVLDGFVITAGYAYENGYGSGSHDYGGGMYNTNSTPTLNNILFNGNLAKNYGGGMFNSSSSPLLTNVTFNSNAVAKTCFVEADPCQETNRYGGGMYNANSSPILTHVVFSSNSAEDNGGGMHNENQSKPVLTDVSFDKNFVESGKGGGMFNSSSSPALIKSTFSGNRAEGDAGGGMYNFNSSLALTETTFSSNSAGSGGGIYNQNSNVRLNNTTFTENLVTEDGAGVFSTYGTLIMTDTTFSSNAADNYGGGMYNNGGSVKLTEAIFDKNVAISGGGMYNMGSNSTLTNITFSGNAAATSGGGLFNQSSSPTLINAVFSSNTATEGGGMYNISNSSATLTNATFNGNIATNGGGMHNNNSNPTLTNTILWGNQAGSDPLRAQINSVSGTPNLYYSLIQDGCPTGCNCPAGLKTVDPQFVNAANDDLHLQSGSPAIDAGDNTASGLVGVTTDRDGNSRFLDDVTIDDSGVGPGPVVDLGAYEFNPKPPTTTSLKATPNPARLGQTISFVATVSAASGTPGGSVTFYNGTTSLGSVNLANGSATLTTNKLAVGTHAIKASYGGNATFLGSQSNTINQVVNPNYIYLPLNLWNYTAPFESQWEIEPNDTYQQANGPLVFDQTYYAYPNNAKDYFSFYLLSAASVTIEMKSHIGMGVQMLLYDKVPVAGGEVKIRQGAPYTITHNGAAGWYYIYIYSSGNYSSNTAYTIKVSSSTNQVLDGESTTE